MDHSSYYTFRTRYAVLRKAHFNGRSVEIVVGYKNLGELSDKLKPFSYRVLKDDCLDLPKKTFMKRVITLSAEQDKVYQQMKKMALAQLNGKMVTTASALTQLMRLHQITCGHFTADDGSIQTIKNNRMSELTDLLDEVEGKAVIWAHYQYDVNEIVKAITKEYGEDSVVTYYGLTPQEERQDNIKRFQEDDKCIVFIGQIKAAGVGLTLTAAEIVIMNSLDWEPDQNSPLNKLSSLLVGNLFFLLFFTKLINCSCKSN